MGEGDGLCDNDYCSRNGAFVGSFWGIPHDVVGTEIVGIVDCDYGESVVAQRLLRWCRGRDYDRRRCGGARVIRGRYLEERWRRHAYSLVWVSDVVTVCDGSGR